jgi:glycerol-3-phosphate dehydrogenase
MRDFSFHTRQLNKERLEQEIFDLVIVGGGINGAGIARDASLRGMKVAVIEARDFASGTSSRSSKLIHGGIRYLENYDFKLVFEALNERTKLFEIAPHLSHHLRFMIPLYQNSRVGMFKMGLGMWAYDALALFQAPEFHERLNPKKSIERMPILKAEGLRGSYVYSDGYMDDDRLVHETLRSANESGAVCVNYVKAADIEWNEKGLFSRLLIRDQLSSDQIWVRGRHLISSVGPWTDELGRELFKKWETVLRPTKGIHLTLQKDRLPLSSAVVMAAEKSDRIVFGIPRHEMVIIGTTDTDFPSNPEGVVATSEDVNYLLEIVNSYFPGARIQKNDIVATYAGVRPLVRDSSSSEGKTSREHAIWSDPRGITFVAGGKYTTYRLMSQQVVDHALGHFDVATRIRFGKANTYQPLNNYVEAERYRQSFHQIESWSEYFSRPPEDVRVLVERYGAEALPILEMSRGLSTVWEVEAVQAIRKTMCLNLTDFMTRRVHLFLAERHHGREFLSALGAVFQNELSLTDSQIQDQIEDYGRHARRELSSLDFSGLTWPSKAP